jgi:hypothetical protein
MIGSIHDKFHALGNGAEFAYNQPVTYEVVEMSDMLLELVSAIHIIVISVVPYNDTRVLHHVFDEAEAWNLQIRESVIWIRSVFDFHINSDLSDSQFGCKVNKKTIHKRAKSTCRSS